MKMVKQGFKHRWWIGGRITCQKCGSVFELEERDMDRANYKPSVGQREEDAWTVVCPECSGIIVFSKSSVRRIAL